MKRIETNSRTVMNEENKIENIFKWEYISIINHFCVFPFSNKFNSNSSTLLWKFLMKWMNRREDRI